MAESDLHRVAEVVFAGSECREDGRERRADVGAECERVHAVEVQHSDSDQRRDGRREDRAALHQHRQTGAAEDRHVAGEVTEDAGEVGVDEALEGVRDAALQQRVEELDDEHEARAEDSERDDEQTGAHLRVAPLVRDVLEHEDTCSSEKDSLDKSPA